MRVLVALSLMLITPPVFADCNALLDRPVVIEELSGLVHDWNNVIGPGSAAIKELLKVEVLAKLKQLEEATGAPLSAKERQQVFQSAEKHFIADQLKNIAQENRKAEERSRGLLYKLLYQEQMSETMEYFHDSYMARSRDRVFESDGGGIHWSNDDRYVQVKNNEVNFVLDLKTLTKVPNTEKGYLSDTGSLFIQPSKNKLFEVRDLNTGKLFGPFSGSGSPDAFNREILIYPKKLKQERSKYLPLGAIYYYNFALSKMKKLPVSTQVEKNFMTEKITRYFPLKWKVERSTKLTRFSDFKEFTFPEGSNFQLSPSGQFVLFENEVGGVIVTTVCRLNQDGSHREILSTSFYLQGAFNGDFLLYRQPGQYWGQMVFFDLKQEKVIQPQWGDKSISLSVISEDGQWVVSDAFIENIESKNVKKLPWRLQEAKFLRNGNYVIFMPAMPDPESVNPWHSAVYIALTDELTEPEKWVKVGEYKFNISATEKYLTTYINGKLSISELRL